MKSFVAAFVVLYARIGPHHSRSAVLLSLAGILAAGLVALAARHASVSAAYYATLHSRERAFLFLWNWKWSLRVTWLPLQSNASTTF